VIGEATTSTHLARSLEKLDLRDRVRAVIYAYESGVVTPGGCCRSARRSHKGVTPEGGSSGHAVRPE
jgi:hypothetical protein